MSTSKNKYIIDIMVVGFALFSMFFGAGNVIFPPHLGLESGSQWVTGFASYFVADIGLAIMTMFALLRVGGTENVTGRIGKAASAVLMSAIILCIGPMVAIPRTAATTFELGVSPIMGISGTTAAAIFSVIFFALIIALSIKESAVIDIVGKILTPMLLVGLAVLIIVGIVNPLGSIADAAKVDNVAVTGIKAGYQTMDVLAAMAFGIIILKSAESKGYTEKKAKARMVFTAALVAGVLLFAVYFGLTYLGASVSEIYGAEIDRSALMVLIVDSLLGRAGTVIFGVVVGLACITTAIALVSSSASFFAKLFNNKISYKAIVIIICVFSAVASNLGIEKIVALAGPVLDIVYPPALVLIIISAFIPNAHETESIAATVGALIISVLTTMSASGVNLDALRLDYLPLSGLGLAWLVPAAVLGIAAFVCRIAVSALKRDAAASQI